MSQELDYPVAAPDGVDPVIYRAQIIQTMATRYKVACADLDDDEANDAAIATWETEWPDDPLPRTIKAGLDCVEEDLAYWDGDE